MDPPRLMLAEPMAPVDVEAVIEAGGWTPEPGRTERLRRTFLDTVDGRLLSRGRVMERQDRPGAAPRLLLRDRATGATQSDAVLAGGGDGADVRFAWDLPAGRLAVDARPLLDVRAVLPFAVVTTRRRVVGVRNRDAKLVARVVMDDDVLVAANGTGRRRPLGRSLEVTPLRGYEREAARVVQLLVDRTGATPVEGDLVSAILDRIDRPPGALRAGARARIEPATPAIAAAEAILHGLLSTIEANVAGTIDEIDTEFLHDLRVAVRRTRSGLKAFPGIFRPGATWSTTAPVLRTRISVIASSPGATATAGADRVALAPMRLTYVGRPLAVQPAAARPPASTTTAVTPVPVAAHSS